MVGHADFETARHVDRARAVCMDRGHLMGPAVTTPWGHAMHCVWCGAEANVRPDGSSSGNALEFRCRKAPVALRLAA